MKWSRVNIKQEIDIFTETEHREKEREREYCESRCKRLDINGRVSTLSTTPLSLVVGTPDKCCYYMGPNPMALTVYSVFGIPGHEDLDRDCEWFFPSFQVPSFKFSTHTNTRVVYYSVV